MSGVCFPVDFTLCVCGLCNKKEGDGVEPTCCKKFILPSTSVVDYSGYDNYSDIGLSYIFGCFYTLCFMKWDQPKYSSEQNRRERQGLMETGSSKEIEMNI